MTEDITKSLFSDDIIERMIERSRIDNLARLEKVKAAVRLLRELDIGCIAASYSGSGDSGSMDELSVYKDPIAPENFYNESHDDALYAKLEQAVAPQMKDSHGQYDSTSCTEYMLDLLDSFAPSGYEINEGGQGVIVLDAVNCEIRSENGTNFTETQTSLSSSVLDEADKLEFERSPLTDPLANLQEGSDAEVPS